VVGAKESVDLEVEIRCFAGKEPAANVAVGDIGHPAHKARDPEAKIGYRQPDLASGCVIEGGQSEAKDGVLRVVVGEDLFEHLGKEGEGGSTGIIDGCRERRGEDFTGVDADEFLARLFDIAGQDVGHGLKGSAEAFAGFCRGFGDALEFALISSKERDDLIGLMDRPGAEDKGFGLVGDHC